MRFIRCLYEIDYSMETTCRRRKEHESLIEVLLDSLIYSSMYGDARNL